VARSLIWAMNVIKELWWLHVRIIGHSDIYSKRNTIVIVKPFEEVNHIAEIYLKFKKEFSDIPEPEEPVLVVDSLGRYKLLIWTPDGNEYIEGHVSDNDGFWLAEAIVDVLRKLEGA